MKGKLFKNNSPSKPKLIPLQIAKWRVDLAPMISGEQGAQLQLGSWLTTGREPQAGSHRPGARAAVPLRGPTELDCGAFLLTLAERGQLSPRTQRKLSARTSLCLCPWRGPWQDTPATTEGSPEERPAWECKSQVIQFNTFLETVFLGSLF